MSEARSCANCGAPLDGAYCSSCGQAVKASRISLWAWLGEAVGELLSIEGPLLRTLRDLATPGRLSTDWSAGRRARHLSPLRLYLFASVLFFATAFLIGSPFPTEVAKGSTTDAALQAVGRRTATELVAALVPLLALTLAILYRRRRRYLVEHVTFAMHVIAAALLVLTVGWLIAGLADDATVSLVVIVVSALAVLAYFAIALQRVYGGSRWYSGFVVATLIVSLVGAAQPIAYLAGRRYGEHLYAMEGNALGHAENAYAIWLRTRELTPAWARADAIEAYALYLAIERRRGLDHDERYHLARLALEIDLPAEAGRIADLVLLGRPDDAVALSLAAASQAALGDIDETDAFCARLIGLDSAAVTAQRRYYEERHAVVYPDVYAPCAARL